MKRLADKISLVTGAGNGIGAAIAARFSEEGAFVYVLDVDQNAAQTIAKQIQAKGGQAAALVCDICQLDQVQAALRQIEKEKGRLDCLVNNAGINVRADFRHLGDEDMQKILDVNVTGGARMAREALALLRKAANSNIINLASIMSQRSTRQMVFYSATRAAMASLSRGQAVEFAPFDIRVNYINPGFVETNLTKRLTKIKPVADQILQRTPMGRFGTPVEIANAAVFFASDDASFVTGAGLNVDGGLTAAI